MRDPDPALLDDFRRRFAELAGIGRDPAGGWRRFAWTAEDRAARAWFEAQAAGLGLPAPELPTAAGHDAGALAAALPTAMLFVRNPTGASHSPAEAAGDRDCALGCAALAAAVEALACR